MGQALPLFVGALALPVAFRGLGPERFGILSLAWMLLGYFSLADLGLGRAITKYSAEALARRDVTALPAVVHAGIALLLLLGLVAAIGLSLIAPLLASRIFVIPPGLKDEANRMFNQLALLMPFAVMIPGLRGVLEADQRFDLVNLIRATTNALLFALPALGAVLGWSLDALVSGLLVVVAGSFLVTGWAVVRRHPVLLRFSHIDGEWVRKLLGFGGWLIIPNILFPVLLHVDRFFLGAFYSVSTVGYYTVAHEMVLRLWIVPSSAAMALFPAFAALSSADAERTALLFARATKYLVFIMGLGAILVILLAPEILRVWMGPDVAEAGTWALRVLTVGIAVNAGTWVAYSFLQGMGRTASIAKAYLVELPLRVISAWLLVTHFALLGAATAWSFWLLLDALFFAYVARRTLPAIGPALTATGFPWTVVLLGVVTTAGFSVYLLPIPPAVQAMGSLALAAAVVVLAWRRIFDYTETESVFAQIRRILIPNTWPA